MSFIPSMEEFIDGLFQMDAFDFGAPGDQQPGRTSQSIELHVNIDMLRLQTHPSLCQHPETGADGFKVAKSLFDFVEDDFANTERAAKGGEGKIMGVAKSGKGERDVEILLLSELSSNGL